MSLGTCIAKGPSAGLEIVAPLQLPACKHIPTGQGQAAPSALRHRVQGGMEFSYGTCDHYNQGAGKWLQKLGGSLRGCKADFEKLGF